MFNLRRRRRRVFHQLLSRQIWHKQLHCRVKSLFTPTSASSVLDKYSNMWRSIPQPHLAETPRWHTAAPQTRTGRSIMQHFLLHITVNNTQGGLTPLDHTKTPQRFTFMIHHRRTVRDSSPVSFREVVSGGRAEVKPSAAITHVFVKRKVLSAAATVTQDLV